MSCKIAVRLLSEDEYEARLANVVVRHCYPTRCPNENKLTMISFKCIDRFMSLSFTRTPEVICVWITSIPFF
jgi:hypothetical protein